MAALAGRPGVALVRARPGRGGHARAQPARGRRSRAGSSRSPPWSACWRWRRRWRAARRLGPARPGRRRRGGHARRDGRARRRCWRCTSSRSRSPRCPPTCSPRRPSRRSCGSACWRAAAGAGRARARPLPLNALNGAAARLRGVGGARRGRRAAPRVPVRLGGRSRWPAAYALPAPPGSRSASWRRVAPRRGAARRSRRRAPPAGASPSPRWSRGRRRCSRRRAARPRRRRRAPRRARGVVPRRRPGRRDAPPARRRGDPGRHRAAAAARSSRGSPQAGVRRLDVLVLTHAQADHEGAALAVMRRCRPRLVLDGGAGWPMAVERALPASALRARAARADRCARPGRRCASAACALRVLWPPAARAGVPPDGDPNDRARRRARRGRRVRPAAARPTPSPT